MLEAMIGREPFWKDECHHPEGSYVASFEYVDRDGQGKLFEEKIDIYLFPDKYHGHGVCLRYGQECSEYYSPGGLENVLAGQYEPYRTAREVLLHLGKIMWVKRS